MQLEMGTLWGSRVLLCSPIGSVLVRVFTDSLGSKSITETTGEMEVERIREPLEEEEAVLLGSSDESPEGSKEQVSGRPCVAPGSPSVVRLGEELL